MLLPGQRASGHGKLQDAAGVAKLDLKALEGQAHAGGDGKGQRPMTARPMSARPGTDRLRPKTARAHTTLSADRPVSATRPLRSNQHMSRIGGVFDSEGLMLNSQGQSSTALHTRFDDTQRDEKGLVFFSTSRLQATSAETRSLQTQQVFLFLHALAMPWATQNMHSVLSGFLQVGKYAARVMTSRNEIVEAINQMSEQASTFNSLGVLLEVCLSYVL